MDMMSHGCERLGLIAVGCGAHFCGIRWLFVVGCGVSLHWDVLALWWDVVAHCCGMWWHVAAGCGGMLLRDVVAYSGGV